MQLEKFLELDQAQQRIALNSMTVKEKIALKDAIRKLSFENISASQKAIYEQQNNVLIRTNNNLASASQHLEKAKERLDKMLNKEGE